MGYRELHRMEIEEVVRRWQVRESQRAIARRRRHESGAGAALGPVSERSRRGGNVGTHAGGKTSTAAAPVPGQLQSPKLSIPTCARLVFTATAIQLIEGAWGPKANPCTSVPSSPHAQRVLHTSPVSPKPRACLVASVRSNSRPATYGPRSTTGTRTDRPP